MLVVTGHWPVSQSWLRSSFAICHSTNCRSFNLDRISRGLAITAILPLVFTAPIIIVWQVTDGMRMSPSDWSLITRDSGRLGSSPPRTELTGALRPCARRVPVLVCSHRRYEALPSKIHSRLSRHNKLDFSSSPAWPAWRGESSECYAHVTIIIETVETSGDIWLPETLEEWRMGERILSNNWTMSTVHQPFKPKQRLAILGCLHASNTPTTRDLSHP